MTMQATDVRQDRKGLAAQVAMTAATVALLGGALLWQGRPSDRAAAPATTTAAARVTTNGTAGRDADTAAVPSGPIRPPAAVDPFVYATVSDQEMFQRWPRAATAALSTSPATISSPTIGAGGAERPTVYIAGSQSQAEALRAANDEADRIRDALGLGPVDTRIMVFASAEQETRFLTGLAAGEVERASAGLPPIRVVDLRTQ